jgi:ABC-type Zn uptake system ZnuABC Zn-binding protein ZnuA
LGGELYSDALGANQSKAGTFHGMFEENVLTIVNALK